MGLAIAVAAVFALAASAKVIYDKVKEKLAEEIEKAKVIFDKAKEKLAEEIENC